MTEQRELDPERFLTTLPRWDQAAFLHQISSGAGALAALKVVPRDPHAPRGDALNTALGTWIAQRWPVVVGALWAWPGAAAQRGGWSLVWAYAPGAEPGAMGEALVAVLRPLARPHLDGRLVVVPVGIVGAEAALRAADDELHRWDHGEPAVGLRWVDAL